MATKSTFRSLNAHADRRGARLKPTAKDLKDMPELPMNLYVPLSELIRGLPQGKKAQITIRLDQDVLKWLRSKGRGYQTKLNLLLRQLMIADKNRTQAS